MKKDKRLIPKGYYCYSRIVQIKGTNPPRFKVIGICPYWSVRKGKPKQENGYCAYLGKGDWDLNKEQIWIDSEGQKTTAEELGFPMSLLWDMVKECNIKDELTAEDKKYFKTQIKDIKNGKLEKHN